MPIIRAYLLLTILFAVSCSQPEKKQTNRVAQRAIADSTQKPKTATTAMAIPDTGQLERQLIEAGLVNIQSLDSNIKVSLKYSTTDNFLGIDVYDDLNRAYLQPDVTEKILKAQRYLKTLHPKYNLLVFDAVRPKSVQQKMWDTLQVPFNEKIKFLSNPKYGSLHNYGAAVDISIADSANKELDMGTPFDYMGELAYPTKEKQLLEEGRLTKEQVNNRQLLRKVMRQAGFFNIQTEWWHFNSCYRKEAAKKYQLIK